jgi:hypothetical protein
LTWVFGRTTFDSEILTRTNDIKSKQLKKKFMEYSEELISTLLREWKSRGYTDIIVVDHGLLFSLNREQYFSMSVMKEDSRVNIYDEHMSGSAWSMHALTLGGTCKGILILGGEIYKPWELTSEIREVFGMPLFSSDKLRVAS